MINKKDKPKKRETISSKKLFLSMHYFQVRRRDREDKTPYNFDLISNPNKKIASDPDHFQMINILKQIFEEKEGYKLKMKIKC